MYVRTKKNQIYRVDDVFRDYRNKKLYRVASGLCFMILDEEEVIKEAETIAGLCDVFIDGNCRDELNGCFYEKYENNALWYKPQNNLELKPVSIYEWEKEELCNIYGAIWTDKGLIYVAKMNDKGELELL